MYDDYSQNASEVSLAAFMMVALVMMLGIMGFMEYSTNKHDEKAARIKAEKVQTSTVTERSWHRGEGHLTYEVCAKTSEGRECITRRATVPESVYNAHPVGGAVNAAQVG